MRTFQRAGAAAALLLVLGVAAFSYHGTPGHRARSEPAAHRTASTAFLSPGHPMVATAGQHRMASILRQHGSVIHSLNWSGYAVARTGASFRNVRAVYFVPYVDCAGSPNSYSSHWAGLDGLNSASVEQVGVATGCAGAAAQCYAWYEMYPKAVSE
jgi:peptidase A4-like protein